MFNTLVRPDRKVELHDDLEGRQRGDHAHDDHDDHDDHDHDDHNDHDDHDHCQIILPFLVSL